MRTHLIHTCGGDITADRRKVTTEPCDEEWPRDKTIRVPFCERCKTIVSVSECRDERIEQ